MKTTDIYMFRRLTLDLGFEWIGDDPDILAVCQKLKSYLTMAAEDDDVAKWEPVYKLVSAYFRVDSQIDFERPFVFSTFYQIACWPLKIKSQEVTHEQEQAYLASFRANERSCEQWTASEGANRIISLARTILCRALSGLDLSYESVRGWYRHGPGAVYEGEVGDDKNYFVVPTRCTYLYPEDSFYANPLLASDCLADRSVNGSYIPNHARLTLVPKDHRGPRGVFIHPTATVMIRQAQATAIREVWKDCPYAKCYNPNSQEKQRERAFIGSASRWYYTLDLKDASDRIPVQLVTSLFSGLSKYLVLPRVTDVELPDGSLHKLRMFAPMGDPLTFDILSLVVWSITTSATALAVVDPGVDSFRSRLQRLRWIERNCESIAVVVGDDLTGDNRYFQHAVAGLEAVNLKVNVSKSYHAGYYREACGMDAYKGVDITPLRQRSSLESDDVLGLIDLHNRVARFRPNWLWVIDLLRDTINNKLGYTLALTRRSDREPCLLQALPGEDVIGWNLFHTEWRFDTTYGELRIVYRQPEPERISHPLSDDRRYDLSYWLIRNGGPVSATNVPYATSSKLVTGSPKFRNFGERSLDNLTEIERRSRILADPEIVASMVASLVLSHPRERSAIQQKISRLLRCEVSSD